MQKTVLNMIMVAAIIVTLITVTFFCAKTARCSTGINSSATKGFFSTDFPLDLVPESNIKVYMRWDEEDIPWDAWFKRGYLPVVAFLASSIGIILLLGVDLHRQKKNIKKNSKDIWEAEENYYRLLEIVSDAIIIIDAASGKILSVNQQAEALTGYFRIDLLDMNIFSLLLKSELQKNNELLETIRSETFIRDAQLNLLNRDKQIVKAGVKGRLVRGYSKTIILLTMLEIK